MQETQLISPTKQHAKIALITGASSGIGEAFARELSKPSYQLDEIWICARRTLRLQELANQLMKPRRITVRTFALDLTKTESFEMIAQELEEAQPNIKFLINAAGWGQFYKLSETDAAAQRSMIDLNCRAVVEGCYQALPYMNKGSRIINLASAAAFVPMPGALTYAASKSFVLSFSRGLHAELAPVGITSTAVCPKAVATEFFAHVGNQVHIEKSIKSFGVELPEQVVSCALRDALRGKDLSISSKEVKALHVASKVAPTKLVFAIEKKLGMF